MYSESVCGKMLACLYIICWLWDVDSHRVSYRRVNTFWNYIFYDALLWSLCSVACQLHITSIRVVLNPRPSYCYCRLLRGTNVCQMAYSRYSYKVKVRRAASCYIRTGEKRPKIQKNKEVAYTRVDSELNFILV